MRRKFSDFSYEYDSSFIRIKLGGVAMWWSGALGCWVLLNIVFFVDGDPDKV